MALDFHLPVPLLLFQLPVGFVVPLDCLPFFVLSLLPLTCVVVVSVAGKGNATDQAAGKSDSKSAAHNLDNNGASPSVVISHSVTSIGLWRRR